MIVHLIEDESQTKKSTLIYFKDKSP